MSIEKHPTRAGWYYVKTYPNGRAGKAHRDLIEGYAAAVALDTAFKRKKTAIPTATQHPRIMDIADEYLTWVERNLAAETHGNKTRRFTRSIIPKLGKYRVKDLTQTILDTYATTVSFWTYSQDLAMLMALITWMKKRGYSERLHFDPEKPRGKHKIKPIPHPADLIRAIENMTNPKHRILFSLMLYTGLRWNEARNIKWEHVFLTSRTIGIREIVRGDQDIVAIPEKLLNWFIENKKTEGLVFEGRFKGKPYNHLWKVLQQAGNDAGVPISSHTFRHASATYLYEQTGDIYQVQAHLRHSKVTTSQVYARMSVARRKSAVDNISDYISIKSIC